MCERIPQNARGIEDRSVKTRTDEMWRPGCGLCQDDAAVTATEPAAHHLLERDITLAAVRRGELRDRSHHRCRAAGIDADLGRSRGCRQRSVERRRNEPSRPAAAVL